MSEEEIFKTLEKACILDKNCYEVDCLFEKDLIAIRELIKLYKNQQKEIDEKATILLAGAEKVKQLEKEIEYQKELYEKLFNGYNERVKEIEDLNEIKQQICNEELITQDYVQDNFISKDKIREKIKELEEKSDYWNCDEIQVLQELLEENDE